MTAVNQLAAQKINADRAGLTSDHLEVPTAHGPQWSEILSGIGSEYGGLTHLFDGASSAPVGTDLAKATNATVGRFGGLIPEANPLPGILNFRPTRNDSVNDPGVVGQTLPGQVATDVAGMPGGYATARAGAGNVVAKLKGLFGVGG